LPKIWGGIPSVDLLNDQNEFPVGILLSLLGKLNERAVDQVEAIRFLGEAQTTDEILIGERGVKLDGK
jgi:hypothetical protein